MYINISITYWTILKLLYQLDSFKKLVLSTCCYPSLTSIEENNINVLYRKCIIGLFSWRQYNDYKYVIISIILTHHCWEFMNKKSWCSLRCRIRRPLVAVGFSLNYLSFNKFFRSTPLWPEAYQYVLTISFYHINWETFKISITYIYYFHNKLNPHQLLLLQYSTIARKII